MLKKLVSTIIILMLITVSAWAGNYKTGSSSTDVGSSTACLGVGYMASGLTVIAMAVGGYDGIEVLISAEVVGASAGAACDKVVDWACHADDDEQAEALVGSRVKLTYSNSSGSYYGEVKSVWTSCNLMWIKFDGCQYNASYGYGWNNNRSSSLTPYFTWED